MQDLTWKGIWMLQHVKERGKVNVAHKQHEDVEKTVHTSGFKLVQQKSKQKLLFMENVYTVQEKGTFW